LIFDESPDLRSCKLSNLLTVHMVPVTCDGHGLITIRNPKTNSIAGNKLGSGITENIHRFLDEAPEDNLEKRVNELMLPIVATKRVNHLYKPRGVPSPLLTAQRGLLEEVSEELHRRLRADTHRFLFLNVVFDLELFIPKLIGVVVLDETRDELEHLIHNYPGKDHAETRRFYYPRLDQDDGLAKELLAGTWDLGGLAAFVSAVKYQEALSNK
jgi:hypothetical protein